MDSVCAIRMDVFIGARTQYVPGARNRGARVRGRGRGDGKRHVYRVWARQRRRARDECRVRSASGSCTTWLFHQIRVEPKIAVRKIKNKVDSFSQAASNVPTSLPPVKLTSLPSTRSPRFDSSRTPRRSSLLPWLRSRHPQVAPASQTPRALSLCSCLSPSRMRSLRLVP